MYLVIYQIVDNFISFNYVPLIFLLKINCKQDILQKLKNCTFGGGFGDVPPLGELGTFSMLKRINITA